MLRRLLLGLVEGSVIGLALAIALSRMLGLTAPGAVVSALLAGGAGFFVGLVAGRPIWARDAKTEALLKGVAGAVVGFGGSFALRRFLGLPLDLNAFSLGAGAAGQLTAVTLPVVSTALALFFELDHDGSRAEPRLEGAHTKRRIEPSTSRAASDEVDELDALDDEVEPKREKR